MRKIVHIVGLSHLHDMFLMHGWATLQMLLGDPSLSSSFSSLMHRNWQ